MTIAAVVGNSVVRLGAQGPLVEQIQKALATLGYPLKGTGYFGGATDTAVTDFQTKQALDADGEVGKMTAQALDAASELAAGGIRRVLPVESTRPLWLSAAIAWIGTKEQPGSGDNPIILNWAKGQGGDIKAEYTHDSIPWCALFAKGLIYLTPSPFWARF